MLTRYVLTPFLYSCFALSLVILAANAGEALYAGGGESNGNSSAACDAVTCQGTCGPGGIFLGSGCALRVGGCSCI